jgi:multisubunit Na+/H+ antiporter MnhC subunit
MTVANSAATPSSTVASVSMTGSQGLDPKQLPGHQLAGANSRRNSVVAPIPRASVITAVVVNPGAFRNCRSASRT